MPRARARDLRTTVGEDGIPNDEAQALTAPDIAKLINKKWPGTLVKASDPSLRITRIPCGILSIDMLLGGGFARRRHFEIYGGYNVGKTYTTYRLIANAQSLGGKCAFVDVEGTFDPEFAEACGVNLETLELQPYQEHGNRIIDVVETLLRSGQYDVVVLDSIAALLPKSEKEADMEASTMGTAQAKMMSAALRRLTAANKKSVMVYINQTREAIGVVFGKRSITSGGKAMGFYAGTRLEMVRTENIKKKAKTVDVKGDDKEADIVVGHRVLVRVEKDKTGGARPHDETTFVFNYDIGGVDPIEDLMYLGRKYGFIKKNTSHWWMVDYEDEKQRGRTRFKRWLKKNRAVRDELEQLIRDHDNGRGADDEEDEDDG